VTLFKQTEFSDPRDRFFGSRGLSCDKDVKVDHSASVADIFFRYISKLSNAVSLFGFTKGYGPKITPGMDGMRMVMSFMYLTITDGLQS
jgi:hypothetical protein